MGLRKYDVFFLVESGIGNALEMFYAVEYCIKNNKKVGIFLNRISPSFIEYAKKCYGEDVILNSLIGVETTNLVHSFTFTDEVDISFSNYYYVNADAISSQFLSETEQYLSIVKGLYPSNYECTELVYLKEDFTTRIKELEPENKIVIYPGSSSDFPIKRWPYYSVLIENIGIENVIVIGGNDDLKYDYSYYYPRVVANLVPHLFLRRRIFYNILKTVGLLNKHAHNKDIEMQSYAFFNVFNWGELVSLFKRAKYFIGNDGGISHLAAVCGMGGEVIFGPSSVSKNKTYNTKMRPVSLSFSCQPCQFKVNNKDSMVGKAILCPYQLRCLYDIKPSDIYQIN